jgi:hypothetical protein
MVDLLQIGSDWLSDQLQQHASRPVTYQRGVETVPLGATIGRTVFELTGDEGIVERIESRDFLIPAVDLVLAGQTVLPERGDQIIETDINGTFTYEVMAPGDEPPWRYSDPYRKTLRVHTKLIAES